MLNGLCPARLRNGAWLNKGGTVLHAEVDVETLKGHAVQLPIVGMIVGTRV